MQMKGVELDFVKARTAILSGPATDREKTVQLRRVENEYCRRLANEPRLRLEVKRRIAETLLEV